MRPSAGGAALAAVLASREVLHGLVRRITWIELRSALMLAVMTAIGLPLLPDQPIDPWGGFNPREVWFFTVLTAAISYLGYIAVKILGSAKGLLVSGLAGALVSSTAVTVAFARTAKAGGNPRPLSGAAALAAMVSVLRVMTVVLVIQPQILGIIGPAALAGAAAFGASGLLLLVRSTGDDSSDVPAKNPFDLVPLLIFAALFAIVSTASAALVGLLGSGSLVATSALSGTFDVDVAVLSALRMVGQSVSPEIVGQPCSQPLPPMPSDGSGSRSPPARSPTGCRWSPRPRWPRVAALRRICWCHRSEPRSVDKMPPLPSALGLRRPAGKVRPWNPHATSPGFSKSWRR